MTINKGRQLNTRRSTQDSQREKGRMSLKRLTLSERQQVRKLRETYPE